MSELTERLNREYPLDTSGRNFKDGWLTSAFENLNTNWKIVSLLPDEADREELRRICENEIVKAHKAAHEYDTEISVDWEL